MSDRSLTRIVQDCARRARNILKKTEPHDIAEYCYVEANKLGLITDRWKHETLLSAIIKMVTIRVKPKPEASDQLRLFTDYEDIVFDLRHDDGVVQKALGDFTEIDIDQIAEQKKANIKSAVAEDELWTRATGYIKPLLKKNPEWKWRDAVRNLEAMGMLPSL